MSLRVRFSACTIGLAHATADMQRTGVLPSTQSGGSSLAARKHAQPTPAKLNPPRVPHAMARERLFAWLDAHAAWPLTWLSGEPGAGKTMLAASYLLARRRAFIWYRLDSDDNDIGQFFATLGQAVEALAGKPVPRPAFSAELSSQPQRYARSWRKQRIPSTQRSKS